MRRVVVSIALALSGIFVGAPAANADHVIDILEDGISCRAGGGETGIGIDLVTTRLTKRLHPDGWVASYTCRFSDVPAYVSAEESEFGVEWVLPARRVTFRVTCWRNSIGEPVGGIGKMTIKPNGTATVTCNFTDPG